MKRVFVLLVMLSGAVMFSCTPKLVVNVSSADSYSNGDFITVYTIQNTGTAPAKNVTGTLYLYDNLGDALSFNIDSSSIIPSTINNGDSVDNTTSGNSSVHTPFSYKIKFTYSDSSDKNYTENAQGNFTAN